MLDLEVTDESKVFENFFEGPVMFSYVPFAWIDIIQQEQEGADFFDADPNIVNGVVIGNILDLWKTFLECLPLIEQVPVEHVQVHTYLCTLRMKSSTSGTPP